MKNYVIMIVMVLIGSITCQGQVVSAPVVEANQFLILGKMGQEAVKSVEMLEKATTSAKAAAEMAENAKEVTDKLKTVKSAISNGKTALYIVSLLEGIRSEVETIDSIYDRVRTQRGKNIVEESMAGNLNKLEVIISLYEDVISYDVLEMGDDSRTELLLNIMDRVENVKSEMQRLRFTTMKLARI